MDLPTFGKSDQADVGEQLQFEAEDALFAGTSVFVLARGLVGGRREVGVAAAAASAVGDDDALVGAGEVRRLFAGLVVVDDGADGDFQDDVDAFAAGFVGAFAVASALGFVFGIEAEVDERVVALAGFHDDVAALAAVAAGRAAAGDELLAAEGQAAVAAVAGFDSDCGFVDEHRWLLVVGGWREVCRRSSAVGKIRLPLAQKLIAIVRLIIPCRAQKQ